MVEQLTCNEKVEGSIPFSGTSTLNRSPLRDLFSFMGPAQAKNYGVVRVVLASLVHGKSAGSAAIGPAAFATKMCEAIGVKSARK